ncbi:protein shisa-4-like [Cryptotermes secundus]|uniref:protein shisa-4-like n=1 Tax=Cryptotermes secundus TaxID=105785 RepID=UPI000CD7BCF2|nr:protein shisa-4-like [Cryptotermes secundus]
MAQSNILILVAVYLTLVGTADLQKINCKDADKDGAPCSRDHDFPDLVHAEASERIETWIYILIGIAAAVFVSIPLCIVCCLFCSICPAYKYRKKRGAVYGATTAQQQPITVYPQSSYPHQPNLQPSPQQLPYPGFVYSHGQEHPQLQPGPQPPPAANEPYYSMTSEYKQPPGAGYTAGAPAEEPPLYENPPQYHNTSAPYALK